MVQEIRKRTGLLTGRRDELAAIASFATGDEGYCWLVGEAWAGKTALLAEAATALPGVDVVCYFLSRREADADSSRFLAAVVPQLASLLEESLRLRTCISSGRCGSAPPNDPALAAVPCCWLSMAWMRMCARPGCPASPRCCRLVQGVPLMCL